MPGLYHRHVIVGPSISSVATIPQTELVYACYAVADERFGFSGY